MFKRCDESEVEAKWLWWLKGNMCEGLNCKLTIFCWVRCMNDVWLQKWSQEAAEGSPPRHFKDWEATVILPALVSPCHCQIKIHFYESQVGEVLNVCDRDLPPQEYEAAPAEKCFTLFAHWFRTYWRFEKRNHTSSMADNAISVIALQSSAPPHTHTHSKHFVYRQFPIACVCWKGSWGVLWEKLLQVRLCGCNDVLRQMEEACEPAAPTAGPPPSQSMRELQAHQDKTWAGTK